jgi:hypothetical protein
LKLRLTLVGAPARATAGVDIAPPAIGSCHALTYAEGMADADPDPAVDCSAPHTSVTIKVVHFDQAPDWDDTGRLQRRIVAPCSQALLAFFGGRAKALQMSAYSFVWFVPSQAQRDAGATWIRCDLVLYSTRSLKALPTNGDPELGSLPLPNRQARCRAGKRADYRMTACDVRHAYRATHARRYPSGGYPGARRMTRWTIRMCVSKLPRSAFYYESPSRARWKAGLRFSVCMKATSR